MTRHDRRGIPAVRLWPVRVPARSGDRALRLPRGQSPGQSLVGEGVRPLGGARRPQPGAADRDHPLRRPAPSRLARWLTSRAFHHRDPRRAARRPARSARRRGGRQPQMPGADRRPALARPCAGGVCGARRGSTASGSRSSPAPRRMLRPIAEASGLPVRFVAVGRRRSPTASMPPRPGSEGPIVITTADNVLLTADGGARRSRRGSRPATTRVVALARKEDVLSAHPEGQRRFYRFRDGEFSNCNLYGLSHARPGARRDVPRGRPVRQESDADRARLRLPQPDPAALRPDHARPGDAAARRGASASRASAVVLADGAHAIDVDNAAHLRDRRPASRQRAA